MDDRPDVVGFEGWVAPEDLRLDDSFSQVIKDHRHHDPRAGDADFAVANIGIDADPLANSSYTS